MMAALRAISYPELLLGVAVVGFAAVAVIVKLAARAKPEPKKDDPERKAEPPPARSFSLLAGLSFWAVLLGLGLFAGAVLSILLSEFGPMLGAPPRTVERLTVLASILSACSTVPAGLSLLLALAGAMAVKHDRAKYGFNLAVFSGALSIATLLLAMSLPKTGRPFTYTRTFSVPSPVRVEPPPPPPPPSPVRPPND